VRRAGDREAWPELVLDGVTQTAGGAAVEMTHRLLAGLEADEEAIAEVAGGARSVLRVFGALRAARPVARINLPSRPPGTIGSKTRGQVTSESYEKFSSV